VDLSALTRAQGAGLLSFKHKEYKEGRGEDARDVCEVEIRLNPAKFNALIKLGEHIGLFRKDGGTVIDGNAIDIARIEAREKMRIEKMEEMAQLYLPAPKTEKAAKPKSG
jgi:phage terminase small subunit